MESNFKPVALVFALIALLAFAPGAAMAKNGGGGGGGDAACGSIANFDLTPGYTAGPPSITGSATPNNLCLDGLTGSPAFNSSNSGSGLTLRPVYGQIGPRTC